MKYKKAAAILMLTLALAGAVYAGTQYYLDNIKLPNIPPGQVVERYFAALGERDHKAAYAHVSRQHYHDSFNQFIDRVSMYSPDMTLKVNWEKIEEKTAAVSVSIVVPMRFGTYKSESEMDLIRDKREWKIVHP